MLTSRKQLKNNLSPARAFIPDAHSAGRVDTPRARGIIIGRQGDRTMVQKASGKLTDMLNKAVARELKVSVQYMWHHVMAKGLESAEIAETFEEVAIIEMKHAEKIAERLWYFDATPTIKPEPI